MFIKHLFVGLIQTNGKGRTFVVSSTDAQTLHTIMGNNVEEDSILENGVGYTVTIRNQKFHTNNIENFLEHLQTWYHWYLSFRFS